MEKLSEPARQQAMNINLVDQQIRPEVPTGDLPNGAQYTAYAAALQGALPKDH